MNPYLHLKCFFIKMLSNCFFFYHKQRRALFCLQDKGVAQSVLENVGFTTSTMTCTRKCLSYSGFCRPISAILRMLNGCLVLVARKLLQSVTNQPDELKL